MSTIISDISRTFSEYILLPNLTDPSMTMEKTSLTTAIARYKATEKPLHTIHLPMTSAIMQSVSDANLAIALARSGGVSFIFCSQSIESQCEMISAVKQHKAGFVTSRANLRPTAPIKAALSLRASIGLSTIAITEDGTSTGKFCGLLTSRDYPAEQNANFAPVSQFMIAASKFPRVTDILGLEEANTLMREQRLDVLPIVSEDNRLTSLVFRKDYQDHRQNPMQSVDHMKRVLVGAGINTHDYKDRVPALLAAGADLLCIDSSDGYTTWQLEAIQYIKKHFGSDIVIGAGNVVDGAAFDYLADAGADFIKVGIGGGSICITREQKGIGRGQASAVIDVAAARDRYLARTGEYIPICSDGGVVTDKDMITALALGADFLMLGRYFARFDESPSQLVRRGASMYKEYWGEGSNRARNWQRYSEGAAPHRLGVVHFEEGVDAYVPYAGKLRDSVDISSAKIMSAMIASGCTTLAEFRERARLTLVSPMSLREGGAHDVVVRGELGFERG